MLHQEKNFFVLNVDEDRLVFAITARETEPQLPIILYDGEKHALFYRNRIETIALDYLDDRVKPILSMGKNVAIAEINPDTEKMVRQYPAIVKIVEKLPNFDLEQ